MSAIFIDRRKNTGGKSTVNRQKFIHRVKKHVKSAVKNIIRGGNIKDLLNKDDKDVDVPVKDLDEPHFNYGQGGIWDRVYNGNKEFSTGDRINRPKQGGGKDKKASKDGEGEDSFQFRLTKKEFLDLFFEDLALPDMVKKQIVASPDYENRRAGFSPEGPMTKWNRIRTAKNAKARNYALGRPKIKDVQDLEQQEQQLLEEIEQRQASGEDVSIEQQKLKQIQHTLSVMRRKMKAVPFIDKPDLRYNLNIRVPIPATQAVMFCVMDVSGSMGEHEKEMAKRLFLLLYLFLETQYDTVDIIYIRHHTVPKEVDEDEFFYGTETGGTVVSPALDLMADIISERYPLTEYNVYLCQASDGDNWDDDNETVKDVMEQRILPVVQYAAYVEIAHEGMHPNNVRSELWNTYDSIRKRSQKLNLAYVIGPEDIWPVFAQLFARRQHEIEMKE